MNEIIEGNMKLEGVLWRESMGKQYAFITIEDLGREGIQSTALQKILGGS